MNGRDKYDLMNLYRIQYKAKTNNCISEQTKIPNPKSIEEKKKNGLRCCRIDIVLQKISCCLPFI